MGVYIKEDSQQNHQAYVLSLLFLRYNETCGLIRALTVCTSNFSFFIPDQSPVGAYMPTVFECACAFIWQIVNIRFE